jgi:uncharacterized membrane protein
MSSAPAPGVQRSPRRRTKVARKILRVGLSWGGLAALGGFVVLWIAGQLVLDRTGAGSFDPYPFPLLELVVTLLGTAAAILLGISARD